MTKRQKNQNARKALPILLDICREKSTITGDDIVDGLISNSYDQDEVWRYVGPLLRIGQADNIVEKTDTCSISKRNRSSLQRVWRSLIWKGDS